MMSYKISMKVQHELKHFHKKHVHILATRYDKFMYQQSSSSFALNIFKKKLFYSNWRRWCENLSLLLLSLTEIFHLKTFFIYRFIYFSKTLIFLFFNYAFNYVVFLFNFYFFKLFNNLLFNILREVYYSFFVCLWYPIFRRLSYFGYFRSNRQKWIEINNENINRLKY